MITLSIEEELENRLQVILNEQSTCLPSYNTGDLQVMQKDDETISTVLKLLHKGIRPSVSVLKKETKAVRKLCSNWSKLKVKDGILYRSIYQYGQEILQLVLPGKMKHTVLHTFHNAAGHQGRERTTALIRDRCFWPFMQKDIVKH
jgi:hypothetical protein